MIMSNELRTHGGFKDLLKNSIWLLLPCFICPPPMMAGDSGSCSSQDTQPAAQVQGSSRQGETCPELIANENAAPVGAPANCDGALSGPANPAPGAAPPSREPEAAWTPATHVNSYLPHWLRFSGEFRDREEGHTAYGFTPGDNDAYGLTRVRLGFDISPSSWFHAYVQARDSEVIGANPQNVTSSMKDVFDLSQAYIEFRNGEHGWLSLKTGRQELYFGDERLVGRSNWSNASRSFDATRLTLGTQDIGAILDVFAASVVKNYPTSLDRIQPGHNFYGVNLALTKLVPRATIEPYVYFKTVPSVTGVDQESGNERLYTSGLRGAGTIPGGFDYRARYSFQSGHYADNSIHARAWYTIFGYTIPKSRFEPRFSMEYNYASGNRAIGSPVRGTFDLLYPTTHQWHRITDLFGEQNITDLKPGFDFKATRKMRVYFFVSDLSLASRYDSLYDSTGAVLVKVPNGGARSKDIGKEGDLYGTYDVNSRLQIGAGYGHLVAGQFLKQASPGGNSSYPYAFADYHF